MARRKDPDQLKQRAVARKTDRKDKPTRWAKTALPSGPTKERRLDILKGQFTVSPEFFEPLPEEELDSWER